MTRQTPKICVLPYRHRLGWQAARLPLADMDWPLGRPEGIEGRVLADLSADDHVLCPPYTTLYFRPDFGTRAQVSVVLLEPRAVHHRHMNLLRLFHRRFHRILTADSRLLEKCPNALLFPTGGAWVTDVPSLDLTKTAMCSLIASEKRKQSGHKLRHAMVDWTRSTAQDIEIMGRGYVPFEKKADGLAPYRYSIVIENAQELNYFSEKLVDALLCETVPIYWGCPNVAEFFDTGGMMICNSLDDIKASVAQMSEADYATRLPALRRARDVAAANYMDVYARAARAVLASG